jgi:membrane protease YdiL (CAAX protease family)
MLLRKKRGKISANMKMSIGQSNAPVRGFKALLARYPLVFYFTITYAFAWLAEMPLVLSKDGVGLLSYGSPLGLYTTIMIATFVGPFLSAFIITAITEGKTGIGHLLRSLVLWRVGFKWYLFALIGLPAIMVLSVITLPGALSSFQGFAGVAPLPTLALFVYIFFLGGPLGEEPGWRGFALPRLQRRYGPLVGSLILGPLWACWHLPIFLIPSWNLPPTIFNIVMFVIAAIAFAVVMTWVFNNTKGSLFMAVLVHTSFDWVLAILNRLFPVPIVNDYGSNVPVLIGLGVLVLVLIVLTRARFGYERYREEVPYPASAPA